MNTRTTTISSEGQVHDDNQRTTTPIPRQKPGTTATEGLLNSNARSSRIFASQPHYIASQKKATEGKQRAKEDQGDHLLKGREKRATSKLGDEKAEDTTTAKQESHQSLKLYLDWSLRRRPGKGAIIYTTGTPFHTSKSPKNSTDLRKQGFFKPLCRTRIKETTLEGEEETQTKTKTINNFKD
ncbi:hypothetical protein Bca4012_022952 [Brassica carinata]